MAVLVVSVVGVIGYLQVDWPAGQEPGFRGILYRVFTLFFAGMAVPDGVGTPWLLLLAGLLAPILLVGGLVATFSERVRNLWTRLSRGHLLIIGLSPFAVALARHEVAERKVVVADDGGDPQILAALRREGVRTVSVELLASDIRARAAAHRAENVVVATGDDELSIDVADSLLAARPGTQAYVPFQGWCMRDVGSRAVGPHAIPVYVCLADRALAEMVTNEEPRSAVVCGSNDESSNGESRTVVACRAEVIAAAKLHSSVGKCDGKRLLIVGAGPFTRALIFEALRVTRSRRRKEEGQGWRIVTVMAPDAEAFVDRLRPLYEGALGIPEVEAAPCEVDQDGLPSAIRRRIAAWREPMHLVVAGDEVAGVETIVGGLKGCLGDSVDLHWVGSRIHGFAGRISEGPVDIEETSADLDLLRRQPIDERLREENEGQELKGIDLLRTAAVTREFVHFRAGARAVVEAINPGLPDLLEDASIDLSIDRVDARSRIAQCLLTDGAHDEAALMLWCEVIRRSTDRAALIDLWNDMAEVRNPDVPMAGWIRRILGVRIAFLSETHDDRDECLLPRDGKASDRHPMRGPVAVFAGGAKSLDERKDAKDIKDWLRATLSFALGAPQFEGVVVSGGTESGLPGVIGDVAEELGLDAAGYAWRGATFHDGYHRDRRSEVGAEGSIEQAIAGWEDIARSGVDLNDVRVIVCSGGPITRREVMIARALNVRVGWLPLPGDETDWDEELPGGDQGVVRLIDDRATIRSFLRFATWPDEEERQRIGRAVHMAYVKAETQMPDDIAMRSWEGQPQNLRDSNIAVADDLALKLAREGLRLQRTTHGSAVHAVPTGALGTETAPGKTLDRLAELEHGRYCSERLLSGWSDGVRNPIRMTTQVLIPWDVLAEDERVKDRRTVLAALYEAERCGYVLVRDE